MNFVDVIVYKLNYGPFRRLFRSVVWRILSHQSRILFGPLKGQRITSGELACLLGVYELQVQYALVDALAEGDVFYDVGANNGFLSLLGAQRVGPGGFVYAFEPLPENILYLRELMSENLLRNYLLVPYAISNFLGTTDFYFGDRKTATPSLIRGQRDQSLAVSTTTLDEFAAKHRWPSLIKLDIEGAEILALEGASKLLLSDRAPKWIIEVHSKENDYSARKFFSSNGYQIRTLMPPYPRPKPYPYHLLAWKGELG